MLFEVKQIWKSPERKSTGSGPNSKVCMCVGGGGSPHQQI